MKVLPILIAITAAVLPVLLTLGCRSVHVTTSRDIDRSVETTWAVFADADNLGTWMHASSHGLGGCGSARHRRIAARAV